MIVFEGILTLKTDIKICIFFPKLFFGSNDVHNKLPKNQVTINNHVINVQFRSACSFCEGVRSLEVFF